MLRQGDWEGQRLFTPEAARQVTSDAGTPGTCGIGWWSNNERPCPSVPRDAFWGAGAGHQILLVVPSLKLIVVRNGQLLAPIPPASSGYATPVYKYLFDPLMEAVTDQPVAASATTPK